MGKGRIPPKSRDPSTDSVDGEKEIEPQTQDKAEFVPPARRPATAIGADTPPPPPREPPRPPPSPLPERHRATQVSDGDRSALSQVVQAVRLAVGALLDLADATADIVRQIEGRT